MGDAGCVMRLCDAGLMPTQLGLKIQLKKKKVPKKEKDLSQS